MVTTFNPPARQKKPVKKKAKPPTGLIVLGVVCVALLFVVFSLNSKSGAANSRADLLSASIVEVAGAVGAEGVTPESLADAEAAPEVLEALKVAVTAQGTDLEMKTAEVEAAQAESARIQGELTTAQEDAASAASKASGDLKKSQSELSALQMKYDKDVASLNAEIESLKSNVDEMKSTDMDEEGMDDMADDMAEEDMEEEVTEDVAAADDMEADAEALAEGANPKLSGVFKGKPESSKYFTSFKYDAEKSDLMIRGGRSSITFSDVPGEVYNSMTNAFSFDLFYRFNLMDVYESKPDAREFIRSLRE